MNSRSLSRLGFLLITMIIGSSCPAFPETQQLPANCQVIVSMMELDDNSPSPDEKKHDLTFFGAAAQKPFYLEFLEYGFETGINFSMENDTDVLSASGGSSGGTVRVSIDNKMFFLDYFAGGYVAVHFANRVRLYAGAGPLLIFGMWEREHDDGEYEDETESKLSAGIYGRVGFEFRIVEPVSIGAGIRGISTGLKFDDSQRDIEVEGLQVFFGISFKI